MSAYLVERCGRRLRVAAEALARLSLGSVERAVRLAEDAAGPGMREQYLKYAAQILSGVRAPDGPEPAAAFLDLLAAQQARIGEEVQEQLARRIAGAGAAVPGQEGPEVVRRQGRGAREA